MKNTIVLGLVAVCSCMGMAFSYGSVAMNNAGFGGFGYYPSYHTSGSSLGSFGGSSSGGGIFEMIIQLFLFIFMIQLLFPSNGNGILGSGSHK